MSFISAFISSPGGPLPPTPEEGPANTITRRKEGNTERNGSDQATRVAPPTLPVELIEMILEEAWLDTASASDRWELFRRWSQVSPVFHEIAARLPLIIRDDHLEQEVALCEAMVQTANEFAQKKAPPPEAGEDPQGAPGRGIRRCVHIDPKPSLLFRENAIRTLAPHCCSVYVRSETALCLGGEQRFFRDVLTMFSDSLTSLVLDYEPRDRGRDVHARLPPIPSVTYLRLCTRLSDCHFLDLLLCGERLHTAFPNLHHLHTEHPNYIRLFAFPPNLKRLTVHECMELDDLEVLPGCRPRSYAGTAIRAALQRPAFAAWRDETVYDRMSIVVGLEWPGYPVWWEEMVCFCAEYGVTLRKEHWARADPRTQSSICGLLKGTPS